MRIAGTATAFPRQSFTQREVLETLKKSWESAMLHGSTLERLHSRTGVAQRHFARPLADYVELNTLGKTNDVWIEVAEELGAQAIGNVLESTGIERDQIGAIYFASITGISSPSIDARLVNRMGLSRHVKRTPIFGLGCVAGAAGLSRAADYVRAYPDQVAILLSVELCSLTWQREDATVANLISTGLFGDGAAAVAVVGERFPMRSVEQAGPRIAASEAVFYPDTEDMMGWSVSETGFRVVLSADVPRLIREQLGGDVDRFLARHDLERRDIGSWIMHTGGPKVLEATQDALGLHNGELAVSWEMLRKAGNLSSASVLVVLDEVMRNRRPARGTRSALAAMGPGFCAELLLLEW
jgi:alkylresorcinol/alkylpyrone synthase